MVDNAPGPAARVLVIEDDPSVREQLQALLSVEPDIEVVTVIRSGADALDEGRWLRPDVIVLDEHMAGMKGSALAATLRREGFRPGIVYYTLDDICIRGLGPGGDECVRKDEPFATLLDAIRRARPVRPA